MNLHLRLIIIFVFLFLSGSNFFAQSFSVDKIADVSEVNSAGDVIMYTITVTNTGAESIYNVIVDDPLIALTGPYGDTNGNSILEVDEVWIYVGTYVVTQSDIDNYGIDEFGSADGDGDIDNFVTVIGDDSTGNPLAAVTAYESVIIDYSNNGNPVFIVEKMADVVEVNEPDDVITYTITVANNASFAICDITIEDIIIDDYDGNLEYVSGDDDGDNCLDVSDVWIFEGTHTVSLDTLIEFGLDEFGMYDQDGDIDNIATVCGQAPNGDEECVESNLVQVDIDYADTDGDTVPDIIEDINGDGDLTNDDTDDDGTPDYLDPDDDDDTVPTIIEAVQAKSTNSYLDTDSDGIPNYLDDDDDGDGTPTAEEDYDNDGDPTNDDINNNGIPDYLDALVTAGVEEGNSLFFRIFPNPVNNVLSIEFIENLTLAHIKISNLQGQVVYAIDIQQSESIKINVSNFNLGVYFVRVSSDLKTQTLKVIIK